VTPPIRPSIARACPNEKRPSAHCRSAEAISGPASPLRAERRERHEQVVQTGRRVRAHAVPYVGALRAERTGWYRLAYTSLPILGVPSSQRHGTDERALERRLVSGACLVPSGRGYRTPQPRSQGLEKGDASDSNSHARALLYEWMALFGGLCAGRPDVRASTYSFFWSFSSSLTSTTCAFTNS